MPVLEDMIEILKKAAEANASDVQMSVGASPRMRVKGKLVDMGYPKLLPANTLDILVNIMNDFQRECFEERGEYDMSYSFSENVRCRVSVYKQKGNVSFTFRLIPSVVPSLERLGAPEAVVGLSGKESGLVLVTGSLSSGKTTTLAGIVNHISRSRAVHVITLERPVEYLHMHDMAIVDQREIGLDSGSYAQALRAALREAPDVIVAGELGDVETVCAAAEAAESGCLVFAEVAAPGADAALELLLDRFPPAQRQRMKERLLAVLQAVVVQRRTPGTGGISMEVRPFAMNT